MAATALSLIVALAVFEGGHAQFPHFQLPTHDPVTTYVTHDLACSHSFGFGAVKTNMGYQIVASPCVTPPTTPSDPTDLPFITVDMKMAKGIPRSMLVFLPAHQINYTVLAQDHCAGILEEAKGRVLVSSTGSDGNETISGAAWLSYLALACACGARACQSALVLASLRA